MLHIQTADNLVSKAGNERAEAALVYGWATGRRQVKEPWDLRNSHPMLCNIRMWYGRLTPSEGVVSHWRKEQTWQRVEHFTVAISNDLFV